MTEALFDRYREALRAGHVAVMRGRLEAAAAWYREAASLASDRAVPRTALGSVELRLGQPVQALDSFDAALAVAPADDAALMGRAQALVVLQRPDEASATFDLLADAREAAAKHPEACDALRRALEIEPTPARRERYRALTEELRRRVGDAEAERALALAPGLLEDAADAPAPAAAAAATAAVDGALAQTPAGSPGGALDGARDGDAVATDPGSLAPLNDALALVVDGDALVLAAEEAATRGDAQGAVAAAMAAARAFRAAGHSVAALDACVSGLSAGPGDVDLHLLIAELAFERDAVGSAGDTYRSLLHLVEIDGDAAARARIVAAARQAFPDDPGFALP
jgi:tetratricopeptide (TPR) repeat protein